MSIVKFGTRTEHQRAMPAQAPHGNSTEVRNTNVAEEQDNEDEIEIEILEENEASSFRRKRRSRNAQTEEQAQMETRARNVGCSSSSMNEHAPMPRVNTCNALDRDSCITAGEICGLLEQARDTSMHRFTPSERKRTTCSLQ
ncbi:hypothetical protein ACP4OV_014618 [Aristida adscensionis]